MPDTSLILLAILITTIGSVLQGSVGLGLGFVAVPLFALIYPDFLPGPLIFAAFFLTILILKREHKSIQFGSIKWAIGGRLIGSALGAVVLVIISPDYLALIFAIMVILAVILSLSGLQIKLTAHNLLIVGTLSGLMSVTAAIGGPPLAMVYQYLKGPELRGTLSGIFVIGSIISIIMLYFAGRFGLYELKLTFFLLPGIFLGYLLSNYTTTILDRGFIRPVVLTFSLLSGIALILKTLL